MKEHDKIEVSSLLDKGGYEHIKLMKRIQKMNELIVKKRIEILTSKS